VGLGTRPKPTKLKKKKMLQDRKQQSAIAIHSDVELVLEEPDVVT
jgi:hypothetical protein